MPWLQSKYILYRIVLKHNNEIGLEVRTYSAKKYKKLNEGLNVLMLSSHDIVYVWRLRYGSLSSHLTGFYLITLCTINLSIHYKYLYVAVPLYVHLKYKKK